MVSEYLQNISIFSDLPIVDIEKIATHMQSRSFIKNQVIMVEEEDTDSLFIIQSGSVKITRTSEDGREVILSLMSVGDFFGELSLLDGEVRSASVVALEDSEVSILTRRDFLDILKQNPHITVSLLQELAQRLRRSDEQIEALSLGDAAHRVALTILRIAEDRGMVQHGRAIIEELPLQQDIANMSGTSRETVSRMLHILEKDGFIYKSGHRLEILNYNQFRETFHKS